MTENDNLNFVCTKLGCIYHPFTPNCKGYGVIIEPMKVFNTEVKCPACGTKMNQSNKTNN